VKHAPVPPAGYPLRRAHRRPPSVSLPSFNAPRPWPTSGVSREQVRQVHRARVRSLYAVDDGVKRIVTALKRRDLFEDTILVFASDNGMAMGSHGLMTKNVPYQDVVRVPLLMTGPGIPHTTVDEVTTLVDLPGTLARLSGVQPMLEQDGSDLFSQPEDRAALIQAGDAGAQWRWRGVYTRRFTMVRYVGGEIELFDRAQDPYETDDVHDEPGYDAVLQDLTRLLDDLSTCAGEACRATY
jgi:N-acetylglucosamine-6-sulfatase